jgi:hypothetical protein
MVTDKNLPSRRNPMFESLSFGGLLCDSSKLYCLLRVIGSQRSVRGIKLGYGKKCRIESVFSMVRAVTGEKVRHGFRHPYDTGGPLTHPPVPKSINRKDQLLCRVLEASAATAARKAQRTASIHNSP